MSALAASSASPKETKDTIFDIPAIVLIGCEDNKPRGAWFAKADLAEARKAAALMNLRVVPVRSGTVRDLARRVPKGRIFSSGKAFTPLIQSKVYEELLSHATATASAKHLRVVANGAGSEEMGKTASSVAGEQAAEGKAKDASFPPDWARIGVGHTVLAHSAEDEAWFEALVVEAKPEGKFTLRWRDYPEDPTFQRKRHQLGLMFPQANAASAG